MKNSSKLQVYLYILKFYYPTIKQVSIDNKNNFNINLIKNYMKY